MITAEQRMIDAMGDVKVLCILWDVDTESYGIYFVSRDYQYHLLNDGYCNLDEAYADFNCQRLLYVFESGGVKLEIKREDSSILSPMLARWASDWEELQI